jgi:hypothetical protein
LTSHGPLPAEVVSLRDPPCQKAGKPVVCRRVPPFFFFAPRELATVNESEKEAGPRAAGFHPSSRFDVDPCCCFPIIIS